jgi:hypothetical protein
MNENSKIKIRNPKQYQKSNFQNSKQNNLSMLVMFFLFWSFEFVSNFVLRISGLLIWEAL